MGSRLLSIPNKRVQNKQIGQTLALVLVPHQANGQGFSLTVLLKLMKNPKINGTAKFAYCADAVRKAIGNIKVSKPYWAVMFKGIIPQSQNMTYEAAESSVSRERGSIQL